MYVCLFFVNLVLNNLLLIDYLYLFEMKNAMKNELIENHFLISDVH